ncbi:MAG: glycine betaine ABC transporter substrate-binding protein [Dysgonamonadaceae bacterium]|nr:glycine betaine ABC transporter substrate-binding protein [Dysgonamonadaceae bacterium]
MKKLRNLVSLALIVGLFASFAACTGSESGKEKVTILYPNWVEAVAYSHLSKVALEEQGYEVELTNLDPGLIFAELSKENSKGDVFMDAWLPNTHKHYWADYGDKLVKLGESFSEGTTGLVVPSYLPINSIEELNANKEKFDGKIIGIDSGAGIHKDTYEAIEEYGLDLEQITSSGPAMVAALQKATRNEDWIVVTGWKPHIKWTQYDLKFLEDPKGIYPTDVCAILSSQGFEEDMPQAANYFKNFNLNDAQLNDLMSTIAEDGEEAGARKWYEANKTMVDGWYNN